MFRATVLNARLRKTERSAFTEAGRRRRSLVMEVIMKYKRWDLRKAGKGAIAAILFAGCFWISGIVGLADSTGKVAVESAKVRKEASTASEVVGSAAKDATITILEEVTDSAGTAWYKVKVDGDTTGYVRADLVNKDGDGGDASQSTVAATADTSAAGGATTAAETAMDAQYASVSVQAAKVRTAPSTNDSVVESVAQNTQMVVSGQSAGSLSAQAFGYIHPEYIDILDFVDGETTILLEKLTD